MVRKQTKSDLNSTEDTKTDVVQTDEGSNFSGKRSQKAVCFGSENVQESDKVLASSGTKHRDFGSDKDVLVTMVMMPVMVYLLNAACNKDTCSIFSLPSLPLWPGTYLDPLSFLLYFAWLGIQLSLHLLVPGPWVQGQELRDKTRLLYKCNGFRCLLASLAIFCMMVFCGIPVSAITGRIWGLMTCATVVSVLLSFHLYARSHHATTMELSTAGNTGSAIYDFYMGHELNPRIGHFDFKFFFELRPGLIGWVILDCCYVVEAIQNNSWTPALILVSLFHFIYVADALLFEETVLTTLDLTTEGFGFMLAFGDLTWVPFIFSLQTKFLFHHPQYHSWLLLGVIVILKFVGYWIFRSSNNEKDLFRLNPEHFSFAGCIVETHCRPLLCGGWWSWSRHPNYFGDMLMALAWCLLNGFGHILPWFYMLYLVGTLIHRSKRDHLACKQKYGADWTKYTARVPFLIIPHIY